MTTSDFSHVLLNAAINSMFLMGPVALGMHLCKRGSGAMRHHIWFVALLALILLPFAPQFMPPLPGPVWASRISETANEISKVAFAIEPSSETGTRKAESPTYGKSSPQNAENRQQASAPAPAGTNRKFSIGAPIFLVWLSGVLILAGKQYFRGTLLRKLHRTSHPNNDLQCLAIAEDEKRKLGLTHQIQIRLSRLIGIPLTWGWRKSMVLLPEDAPNWESERLRLVLRHEFAHINRRDCLVQRVAEWISIGYWFNPLVWLALANMRKEREHACDDAVLFGGTKPSDYATLLLDIARRFSAKQASLPAIAMANPSNLEQRIKTILDASRTPQRLRLLTGILILAVFVAITLLVFGPKKPSPPVQTTSNPESSWKLIYNKPVSNLTATSANKVDPEMEPVRAFIEAKGQQAIELAKKEGITVHPDVLAFFQAGSTGDWQTFTNLEWNLRRRHTQYEGGKDSSFHKAYWSTALESFLLYDAFAGMTPRFATEAGRTIVDTIPAESIYFGGTDPGRGLPTGLSKSHANADPFYTITQNALADGTYLQYLEYVYGDKIYTPKQSDSQNCFAGYLDDAQKRMQRNELKPGENVQMKDNRVQVSGQVAVMEINARLAKIIFDKNPDKEFFIEESFPLDWMYPHLIPHGLIMKINRSPLNELKAEDLNRDREYWDKIVSKFLGKGFSEQTKVSEIVDFVGTIFVDHNLQEFTGNKDFVQNIDICKFYSKLRSSIGGVYAWRANHSNNDTDKKQMEQAADNAFRQAFLLCPSSPEAIYRYVSLLTNMSRKDDALQLVQIAEQVANERRDKSARQLRQLEDQLRKTTSTETPTKPPR